LVFSSWNVLGPISSGVLQVSPIEDGVSVGYRLKFTEVLVFATVGVGAVIGPGVMSVPNIPIAGRLGILAVGWLWLVGGNYVVTRWRLPSFLVRSVEQSAT
jgi:hypothetical protein